MQAESTSPEAVLTVTQVNRMVRQAINRALPQSIWLAGELTDVRIHNSGHLYFTLKDDQSVLPAVFFSGAETAREQQLENGMAVEVSGRIDVYEPQGRYQIIVDQIRPAGMGDLQRRFLELREKLLAEGLFDEARKKPIPAIPKCIGLITSTSGAAMRDFFNVINRRNPNVHIRVINARMQGEGSAIKVIQALRYFNRHKACDVIVITRGGGSMEDLWCFNDEQLVRQVAASEIPVISAIGHEIDFTLCDFAADRREPTPSAAAEVVIGAYVEMTNQVNNLGRRLKSAVTHRYQNSSIRLGRAANGLQNQIGKLITDAQRRVERCRLSYPMQHPEAMVLPFRQRVDIAQESMIDAFEERLKDERHRLVMARERLGMLTPRKQVDQLSDRVRERQQQLNSAMRQQLRQHQDRLQRLSSQLRALDPTAVLSRGYSIMMTGDGKKAIRSYESVSPGDMIVAMLHDGRLDVEVKAAVAPEDTLDSK